MRTNAMPVSSGKWMSSSVNASSPPAEAPTATTIGVGPAPVCSPAVGCANVAEDAAAEALSTAVARLRPPLLLANTPPLSSLAGSNGRCQQPFQDTPDLHELIEAGGLGDELRNAEIL